MPILPRLQTRGGVGGQAPSSAGREALLCPRHRVVRSPIPFSSLGSGGDGGSVGIEAGRAWYSETHALNLYEISLAGLVEIR